MSNTVKLQGAGFDTIELPVLQGTLGNDVIDIRALKQSTNMFTLDPGFVSTASCESKITFIDGDKGLLYYRGYPIEQLAEHSDYLEVCYLLIYGELPTKEQKKAFVNTVTRHTMVHEQLTWFFRGFRRDAHPMALLARPIWIVPPTLVPQIFSPTAVVDLAVLDASTPMPVPQVLPAFVRAEQVLVVGDSRRAIVIPNGIVTSEFDASYAARLAAIEEIKKEGADKHLWKLVYIARVVPIKGLLDMIDSVRIMVDRGLNIHLDVCGPTEHMPSYFEQCLTRIVEQGLESVITIRGTVKVRELLPEFDLFVLPSYNEGLPVVSLETMGAGIPTVSTDVGAVRSVVEDMIVTDDGQTWDPCGIIIEPGDPTVMADKVQEVISDVDLYERLSLNARGRVEAAYDLVKVNASYNKICRQGGAGEQAGARADQGGA